MSHLVVLLTSVTEVWQKWMYALHSDTAESTTSKLLANTVSSAWSSKKFLTFPTVLQQ
jgi:hypothetical protein